MGKNFPKLKTVEEVTKNSTEAVVSGHFQKDVAKRYAPLSLEVLRYSGYGARRVYRSESAVRQDGFAVEIDIFDVGSGANQHGVAVVGRIHRDQFR